MDYEKKYKDTLERAEKLLDGMRKTGCLSTIKDIKELFPEFQESEDEKIRKDLIWAINKDWFMNGNTIKDSKFTKKDILAWLDRQSNNYSHLIELKAKAYDDAKDRMSYAYNQNRVSISFVNEIFPNIKLYENQSNKPKGKTALEAINEEKVDNSNKVESPFHEGDWIVSNNTKIVLLIKYYSFYLNAYTFEDINGHTFSPCTPPTEEAYHLWSIKDAKDGDVLQLGKVTAIFQTYISNIECRCYCSVFEGEFKIPIHYNDSYGCHNAIPATKEQRDTLIKAMADAGYTFDFEKKELKRIENEIEIPYGSKDSELIEESYYIPKGFHAEIDEDKVVIKKGEKSTDNANKVGPKFKVGDWIVSKKDGTVHKVKAVIENISNGKYGYDLTNGGFIPTSHESDYRLLSINDDKIEVKKIDKLTEEYNITGIGSKHAQGKLGEMIKNIKSANSIWHDNKCIPDKDDKEILVEYNLNKSTRPNHLFHDVAPYDSSSKMFHCYSMHLKLEEIIRWAYMDDILQVVNR